MSNLSKLFNSFSEALSVPIESINLNLEYQGIPEWDSISHMVLIAQIESDFDISIDTDDVIDMNSVNKAIEILDKYGVNF